MSNLAKFALCAFSRPNIRSLFTGPLVLWFVSLGVDTLSNERLTSLAQLDQVSGISEKTRSKLSLGVDTLSNQRLISLAQLDQVSGIAGKRDQNYHSDGNYASQWHVLHRLEYPVGYPITAWRFFSIDTINLFSDAFGPRGEKLHAKQVKISEKNQQIQPSPDRIIIYFSYDFNIILILDLWSIFSS